MTANSSSSDWVAFTRRMYSSSSGVGARRVVGATGFAGATVICTVWPSASGSGCTGRRTPPVKTASMVIVMAVLSRAGLSILAECGSFLRGWIGIGLLACVQLLPPLGGLVLLAD